jgi:hypothetical protein
LTLDITQGLKEINEIQETMEKKKLWTFNDKFRYEKDCLQTQQAVETINITNDNGGNIKQRKPKLNIT